MTELSELQRQMESTFGARDRARGIPATVESLQFQTKLMVPGSEWEVIGISRPQWRMIAAASHAGEEVGVDEGSFVAEGERIALTDPIDGIAVNVRERQRAKEQGDS